ncbi:uncharacterized protein LOC112093370 [Morus notabilis]|uniref:uncharacterized protein LOC112093370 n=1 Tax=Morus notabilis TaxID=981085 RepID=UPI000CED309C|nr:uncharacterized protein LOC112093370 [Morus notabilis]XP_024027381.1 uncharacterized protein LOC112093370 [Morus notabilis]XP_024027382.1 uncharacterized protein LOC112093370 [Morus notabilis]
MDFFLVVAAAGAGYLAKYWQSIPRDRDRDSLNLLQSSSGDANFKKPESPGCPLRSLERRTKLRGNVAKDKTGSDKSLSDISSLDDASGTEVASTSGTLETYQDSDILSVSNLQSGFSSIENLKNDEGGNRSAGNVSDNCGDLSFNPSAEEVDSFNDSMRKRSPLRTKLSHAHFIKPMSSLESCLLAQLYKEHAEMAEYVLSSLPSPATPTMRTLFVTDGSRVISRAYNDSLSALMGSRESKLNKEARLEKNEKIYGVPPLPKVGYLDPTKKMKAKTGKGKRGELSSSTKMTNGKDFHSQGSLYGTFLFFIGMSIGMLSSFMTSKSEVDKLKDLLKQTENLVQDLQEELEMKDSLTVKELANETYESQGACDNSISKLALNKIPSEQNIYCSTRESEDSHCQKANENSESISKIEAELEAELERLGLNMNVSTLERRLSEVVELDADFEADFAQGELRVDTLGGEVAKSKSNEDGASTSTTHHSGNHAVSPRELSLRLHEVIQSRLEERVNELEIALQNSQRKIKIMESGRKNRGEFSNGRLRYLSSQESPIAREDYNSMSHPPLVINLSGEAIDAYNEAHEELMKMSDSEEEDSPRGIYEDIHYSHSAIPEEKSLGELFPNSLRMQEEHISLVLGSNDTSNSGDEISDCKDEMEKELIKQIVERTKKGSPVVLNAQRLLFSMDENELLNEKKF